MTGKPYRAVLTPKQKEFNKLFGQWLRRNMKKKFWTYEDVAINTGVSRQTACNWVHGDSSISLYHYLMLRNCFKFQDDVFDLQNFGEILKVTPKNFLKN